MKIINPSVEIINETNCLKKIEMAARTCYKSEKKITDTSALSMCRRLFENKHTAMFEHAYLVFDVSKYVTKHILFKIGVNGKYLNTTFENGRCLISGNLRAIMESNCKPIIDCVKSEYPNLFGDPEQEYSDIQIVDIYKLNNLTPNEIKSHFYMTMRFITDRGVTHEIVRHRTLSFAQESTRYVKYNEGDIQFVKPANWGNFDSETKSFFNLALESAALTYDAMISNGITPQEARAILPNALKTEIVVTGNGRAWEHFFDLRSRGTTGKPHPDMKQVADMALKLYEKEILKLNGNTQN